MPSVQRTFDVTATPTVVLEYLKDFAHAEEWDPGTVSSTRTDAGAIAVGSTWHNVSKVAGVTTELTYTLREMGADHLVFVGVNDSATSTDTITVGPSGAGSTVTYLADIQMRGLGRLAAPAVKLIFERVAHETEAQLIVVLNRLAEG